MNAAYASDEEIRDAIRRNERIRAIIPVGSLEQHGRHLPLATDSIIAEHIASIIAERMNALLLPCIGYGISYEHEPFFSVSISAPTLCALVDDLCRSLAENGIRRIIILNAHYGNEHALLSCVKELAKRYRGRGIMISSITYSLFLDRQDHAGEYETSLMLAIRPDLVRIDLVSDGSKYRQREEGSDARMDRVDELSLSRITLLPGSMVEIARDGVIGNPAVASRDRGSAMLEEISVRIIRVIEEVEHLYEKMGSKGQ